MDNLGYFTPVSGVVGPLLRTGRGPPCTIQRKITYPTKREEENHLQTCPLGWDMGQFPGGYLHGKPTNKSMIHGYIKYTGGIF